MTGQKSYILFYYGTWLATYYSSLARYLRGSGEIGSILVTLGNDRLPNPDQFEFATSDFDDTIDISSILEARSVENLPPRSELTARAQVYERRYGVNLNDVLRVDRHFGIGFVTGAKFMRPKIDHVTSYEQRLDVAIRMFDYFEALFDRYKFLAWVGVPSTIGSAVIACVGASHGVPMRRLEISSFGKKLFWSDNWEATPLNLEAKYGELVSQEQRDEAHPDHVDKDLVASEFNVSMPYRSAQKRDGFKAFSTISYLVYRFAFMARWAFSKAVRRKSWQYGDYLLSARFAQEWRQWIWHRRTLREPSTMEQVVDGTPYVFLPLHVEPEVTLMVDAFNYNHQLAYVDWLVKSLPAGWRLVVKEHFGSTCPRPAGFWDQLAAYPNVLIAATLDSADEILQHSRAVATINGTVGLQAAISGQPVITFHPKFHARMLAHVFVARSMEDTQAAIHEIVEFDTSCQTQARATGRVFDQAYRACTFEVENKGLLSGVASDDLEVNAKDTRVIAENLMDSLGIDLSAPYSAA